MTDTHTDPAKTKAEATFKRKELQAREGVKAMAEYIADQAAMRVRTEKLKALRLAKEAAEQTAADAAPVAPKKKAKKG
jgi:hypothetical protein